MRCNMAVNVPPCDATCEKQLGCGRHFCPHDCHHGVLIRIVPVIVSVLANTIALLLTNRNKPGT